MKKILSVVLAGAMIMGMSVASFADLNFGSTGTSQVEGLHAGDLAFDSVFYVVRDGAATQTISPGSEIKLQPGDELYFAVMARNNHPEVQQGDYIQYTGQVDKDWSINIKTNDYVDNAQFYTYKANDKFAGGATTGDVFVKISLDETYDNLKKDDVNFYFYIADNEDRSTTEKVTVKGTFNNRVENYVSFDFTNDADHTAKWVVENGTQGTAVFDFEDNCYFTVKMYSGEEVILNLDRDFDSAIHKKISRDADVEFYNFNGKNDEFNRNGELFLPADKGDFVYEIVDGEVTEIDADYVEGYKVGRSGKSYNGFIIKTHQLGYYVVSDTEAEANVDEDKPVEDAGKPVEKPNPPMGANDFVGAAVALAVVSVAAAGALSLKK